MRLSKECVCRHGVLGATMKKEQRWTSRNIHSLLGLAEKIHMRWETIAGFGARKGRVRTIWEAG